MEKDNEVSGNGNSYTTEFRQYDPRLGRWKSLDPLMYQFPWMSPYCAFDNNPIYYTDPYGLSSEGTGEGDPPRPTAEDEKNGSWINPDTGSEYTYEDGAWSQKAGEFEVIAHADGINPDNYYRYNRESGKWDETSPVYNDAIQGNKIKYINWQIGTGRAEQLNEKLEFDQMMLDTKREQEYYQQAARDIQFGSNPFYLGHKLGPTGTIMDISKELSTGGYMAAGGMAVLELIPGELDDGYKSFRAFKRANGAAGEGMAWHHIVEQTPLNFLKFGPYKLHNINNLIRLPHGKGTIHAQISGYYSSINVRVTGSSTLTIRKWLSTKSYEEQFQFGIKTLKEFGWE